MSKRLYLYLFIAFLFLVGFFIVRKPYQRIRTGLDSKEWPSVVGVCKQAELGKEEDWENGTEFSVHLLYAYEVDGIAYQNTRISTRSITDRDAEDLGPYFQRYVPDQPVTVYYNPDNPGDSLLEPGSHFGAYFLVAFGLCFFLFGGWLILADLRG